MSTDAKRTEKALREAMDTIRNLEAIRDHNADVHTRLLSLLYDNERLIPSILFGELSSTLRQVKPLIKARGT